jgi:hypothetical protein
MPGDRELFKVQWPLAGHAVGHLVLIYNKNRSVMEQLPLSWFEDLHKLAGKAPKTYVYGTCVKGNIVLEASSILPEEEWPEW